MTFLLMLAYALSICWAVIVNIYTMVKFIFLLSELTIYDWPENSDIVKFLAALTATISLWWLVWMLSFYI